MTQRILEPPLELPFPPDDYLCTWQVLGLDGETLQLPGSISVQADRQPRGVIHGDLPLESTTNGTETSFTFPQTRHYTVLRATLVNGGTALFLDTTVHWHPNQGNVYAAAAVLRRRSDMLLGRFMDDAAPPDGNATFQGLRLQVGAIDAVMGVAPLRERKHPTEPDADGSRKWTVTTNPAAVLSWDDEGDRLDGHYLGKINTFDFYNVRIRHSPVLDARFATSMTLFDAVKEWVEPIRAITSIATGTSQPICYLALAESETSDDSIRSQVYGTAIKQAPFESDSDSVRAAKSVLHCAADNISLLDLIHKWRHLQEQHHPLIETYGGMLHADDQHPRSRFLLLLQSLEGMHGLQTMQEFEQKKIEHGIERNKIIEGTKDVLDAKQRRFVKQYLSDEPFRNLETALAFSFNLPVSIDITDRIAATNLVKQIVAENLCPPRDALRIARNGLAHGARGFDAWDLNEVNEILERVVRAHALLLLGCPEEIAERVLAE